MAALRAAGKQTSGDFMTTQMILSLAAVAAAYNIIVYAVYWWDKRAARNGAWRVQESTLLLLAFAGGGAGALAAQRLLRHKTRKPPFPVVLPLFFILQVAWLAMALLAPQSMAELLRLIAGD